MKMLLGIPIALALAGFALWQVTPNEGNGAAYRFTTVERGDLEAIVSSTGNLQARTTVQVGTQVSGQIAEIFVDFNDRVRAGQLIARIDPALLKQEVFGAEASLERSEADFHQQKREFERFQELYQNRVVSEVEYNAAQYSLATATANLKSAQVNLDRARQDLGYSEIRAPIDGVVIERNVDIGQTVAASLSAPQLFLIAEDLSQMEILVSVDESDIGMILENQVVRFNVQAYSDETFHGAVRQVRLQSTISDAVVNYTVVVEVSNDSGIMLPGMTATVDFLVASARDVLKVSNAALRFRPTDEMIAMLQAERLAEGGLEIASNGGGGNGPGMGSATGGGRSEERALPTMLWYLDEAGELNAVGVGTGLTDGQATEVEGPGVKAGLKVIVGISQNGSPEGSSSPFQSQQQSSTGPGRRPGSF